MAIKSIKKNKNPPIMSHEFIIQNHADIVSCIAMVFVAGLLFQVSTPLANIFVIMSYNASAPSYIPKSSQLFYSNGMKDCFFVFFYTLVCIIVHAVIQEFVLDKITKKLHLSKTKFSKFNESGQLLFFMVTSTAAGVDIILNREIFTDVSSLWANYPEDHVSMPFLLKLYFLIQLSYWIHTIPELYFQKVKREDMLRKLNEPALYFVVTLAAYLMNFTRVGLVILVLRFADESVLQVCKLLSFAEKTHYAEAGFKVWNVMFVACRLLSFIVTILTFHYGLATLPVQGFNLKEGNFNNQFIRINTLTAVCLLQAWLMWNFIHFHLRRSREQQATKPVVLSATTDAATKTKGKRNKKDSKKYEEDVSMLPEADQNSRRRK